ncbi:hypothetical protein EXIGLDRAFT_725651 [Exidia glandulosa HHB12029]|uniref:Family A G protein-coupled receptor-like protein n=1 Tax=Exidia glandulosa HHB12029 TaxID=1314781 RepID=A0A166BQF0_EXIGL|nr:hypothetical protein EXIGLDRAFT_725651 [Exidia glandulosa HHB12029]
MSSNASMDAALLVRVGNGVVQDMSAVISGTGLYGVYLVLICVSTYSIMRQNWRRPTAASIVLLVGTVTMFMISTYLWAVNVGVLVRRIRLALVEVGRGPLATRLSLANTTTARIRYSTDLLFIFEYLIGDAIIAWRVFVLYRWAPWVIAILVPIWLGSLATGLGLLGCLSQNDFALGAQLPKLCPDLENASWTISLALNAISTVLMARIAWNRRKETQHPQYTGPRKQRSKVDRVLSILVVSGLVYFILGISRLTAFANSSLNPLPGKVSFANEIIEFMFDQLVGIYPTAVTVFVLNESSIFGSALSSTFVGTHSEGLSQSIHFKTKQTEDGSQHNQSVEMSPTRLDPGESGLLHHLNSGADLEKV